MRGFVSAVVVALSLCGAAVADSAVAVQVDTAAPGAKIDRHIFGQFAEQLGTQIYDGIWVGKNSKIPNTRGIRKDVVAALKALHVPLVRWPGGCYADQYHWRDGIGKIHKARVNASWGNVADSNAFGTHEFMDLVEQIGADAYISLNVGSGTVKEAADWVEYMTAKDSALAKERAANGHPAPYKVQFLGLGNESWDCGGLMTRLCKEPGTTAGGWPGRPAAGILDARGEISTTSRESLVVSSKLCCTECPEPSVTAMRTLTSPRLGDLSTFQRTSPDRETCIPFGPESSRHSTLPTFDRTSS